MRKPERPSGGRRSDRGDRTGGHEPDLEDLAEELSTTLRDLRREVRGPSGPFGLPRPPSVREVLRFTESYAIPTAIAVLEANIRALELLAAVLRAVDGSASGADRARDRAESGASRARERAESVSRATLDRLDDALVDLQNAIEGRPDNAEARHLVDDARALRAEIEDRLRASQAGSDREAAGGSGGSGGGGDTADPGDSAPEENVHEVPVDVEGELESIKRGVDESDGGRRRDEGGTREG